MPSHTQPPLPTDPPAERARLAAALALRRAGDFTAAAQACRAILADNPHSAEATHLLGLAQAALGHIDEAVALLRQAVSLAPSARHAANLAALLHRLHRHDEARAACDDALRLDPCHVEALNTRGAARLALGDPAGAIADASAALAHRPAYYEALINLANAHAQLERPRPAEQAFRAAFALRPPSPSPPRRVLFLFNDPTQPGHIYRCHRMASAARAAGWDAHARHFADLTDEEVIGLAALVFWRFEFSPRVCRTIALARAAGARVGLDLDDLVADPAFATPDFIDAIGPNGIPEPEARAHIARIQRLLAEVDFGSCSTDELAAHLRRSGRPVHVIPNGFDSRTLRRSRAATRRRPEDGLFRIGYAGGTRTHQRDFQRAAPALAAFLAARPHARLVLFRDLSRDEDMIDLAAFPHLAPLAAQIEWRPIVPLEHLPDELARFDLNIAPLEAGNPFVECKSELKFFEAALVNVPTIASPTGPFRRAIRHGESGWLADTVEQWLAGLERLAGSPALRRRLAAQALRHALPAFGPAARAKAVDAMLHAARRAESTPPATIF